MDANSISPSGRPQRSGNKRSLKGAEMDQFQESERAAKRQSISPRNNASSAPPAAAAASSSLPSSPSEQDATDLPTFSNLPSPVVSLSILDRKPPTPPSSSEPTPPKSRKPLSKPQKSASPKESRSASPPPPPPTFTCSICSRPYTIPLTIDIDPLSRPMQTHFHARLAPNRITGGLHGRWRNQLVDANLRYEAFDNNLGCPHIARMRLEYAQACEDWFLGAEARFGAGVGSQADFERGVEMPWTASERAFQANSEVDTGYVGELITDNRRKTHDKFHEAYIKSHNEECWERGAKAAGVSVEEYLKPKRLNMRTSMPDGCVARALTTKEIKDDLKAMGIDMVVGKYDMKGGRFNQPAVSGYDDVECRPVGFYRVEGTPDYWDRVADWEKGVSA